MSKVNRKYTYDYEVSTYTDVYVDVAGRIYGRTSHCIASRSILKIGQLLVSTAAKRRQALDFRIAIYSLRFKIFNTINFLSTYLIIRLFKKIVKYVKLCVHIKVYLTMNQII